MDFLPRCAIKLIGILGRFHWSINLKSVKTNDVSEAKSVPCHLGIPHNLISWVHWDRRVRELILAVLSGPNALKCIILSDEESRDSYRNVMFFHTLTYEGKCLRTRISLGSCITR
jgi:hypothetical protein